MIEVRIYQRADGRKPFDEWLASLADAVAVQRITARLTRVRAGNFGDCKSVGGGVLELRVDHGPGYRVYIGRHGQNAGAAVMRWGQAHAAARHSHGEELLE